MAVRQGMRTEVEVEADEGRLVADVGGALEARPRNVNYCLSQL